MQIQVLKALSLTWICFFVSAAQALCPPSNLSNRPIQVASVTDGDSVVLSNGTRVRVIGINTPEIANAKYNRQGEPFGEKSKQILSKLLENRPISARYGAEEKDKYKRRLLYLYDADGQSINALMLKSGAARLAATPPNISQAKCFQQQSITAQHKQLGLWASQQAIVNANELSPDSHPRGFITLQGRISKVNQTKKSVWLTLTPTVSVRIYKKDWKWFDIKALKRWTNQSITVNGYFYWHNKRATIMLRHPSMITLNKG